MLSFSHKYLKILVVWMRRKININYISNSISLKSTCIKFEFQDGQQITQNPIKTFAHFPRETSNGRDRADAIFAHRK